MCCKCFCATLGDLNISPVFLPVMNYTPEGDSWWETIVARWTQANRHALGISEVTYFSGTVPFILADGRLSWAQRLRLLRRGGFLWLKMLMVHLGMAFTINTFTFLASTVVNFISATTFVFFLYTNVLLYDHVAPRIQGADEPGNRAWWGRRHLHYLSLVGGFVPNLPFFLAMGGLAEWIAAAKTAFTHKFHYEVALKPQIATTKAQQPQP